MYKAEQINPPIDANNKYNSIFGNRGRLKSKSNFLLSKHTGSNNNNLNKNDKSETKSDAIKKAIEKVNEKQTSAHIMNLWIQLKQLKELLISLKFYVKNDPEENASFLQRYKVTSNPFEPFLKSLAHSIESYLQFLNSVRLDDADVTNIWNNAAEAFFDNNFDETVLKCTESMSMMEYILKNDTTQSVSGIKKTHVEAFIKTFRSMTYDFVENIIMQNLVVNIIQSNKFSLKDIQSIDFLKLDALMKQFHDFYKKYINSRNVKTVFSVGSCDTKVVSTWNGTTLTVTCPKDSCFDGESKTLKSNELNILDRSPYSCTKQKIEEDISIEEEEEEINSDEDTSSDEEE